VETDDVISRGSSNPVRPIEKGPITLIEGEHGEVNPRLGPRSEGTRRPHNVISYLRRSTGSRRRGRLGGVVGRGDGGADETAAEGAADLGEVGEDPREEGRGRRRRGGGPARGEAAVGGRGRRGVGVRGVEQRVEEAGDVEEVAPQLREVVADAAQPARHPLSSFAGTAAFRMGCLRAGREAALRGVGLLSSSLSPCDVVVVGGRQ
jgi:hypothetical protein